MKYKTYDENETIGSIFFFIFSTILLIFIAVLFAWLTVPRVKYDPMWYKDGIFYLLLWLFYFAVQMSFYKSFKITSRRFIQYKKIIREGTRYDAVITKAEYIEMYRKNHADAYYLYIDFTDESGVKKTFITPPYWGNVNYYLKDGKCCVYKLDGKYAASDFSERPFLDYFKFFYIEERIKTKKCKNREESEQNTEGEICIYQKG